VKPADVANLENSKFMIPIILMMMRICQIMLMITNTHMIMYTITNTLTIMNMIPGIAMNTVIIMIMTISKIMNRGIKRLLI